MTLAGIRSIKDVSYWEGATAAYYESVYNNDENDAVDDYAAAVVGGSSDGGVVGTGGGIMVDVCGRMKFALRCFSVRMNFMTTSRKL